MDTCKLEFVNVVCGENSGRKRRSAYSHSIHKRNDFTLILLAVMKKWDQENRTAQEYYSAINADLNSIADVLEQNAHDGTVLNLPGFTLPNDGVQRGSPNLFCNPGYKVDTGSLSCSKI